jgi:amidase
VAQPSRVRRGTVAAYEMVESEPVLSVREGERFVLETEDALNGVLQAETDLPVPAVLGESRIRRSEFNPCVGPISVVGAEPGDTLAVTIDEIVVAAQGVTCIRPEFGPLAGLARYPDCQVPYTKILQHLPGPSGTTADGFGVFNDTIRWKLNPHIGAMGTAPERPVVHGADTVFGQSKFGGNVDCRDFRAGNTVYFPVEVPGACLYVGDVHASMADGEYYGTADESRAEVTLTCTVHKRDPIPWVRIDTPTSIIQLHSARPLEDAVEQAFLWLLDWLIEDYGFSARDAYMNLCINPGVRINVYQLLKVGRFDYTVGVEFPKDSLPPGFSTTA